MTNCTRKSLGFGLSHSLEPVMNFQAGDRCGVTPEASEPLAGGGAKRNHRESHQHRVAAPAERKKPGVCIARAPAGAPFVLKRSSGGFATLHHRLIAFVLSGRRGVRTHLTHRSP